MDPNIRIIPTNSTQVGAENFMRFVRFKDTKFICGVITTPTCKRPTKLTGLGDNISSTGFTYQKKLKS